MTQPNTKPATTTQIKTRLNPQHRCNQQREKWRKRNLERLLVHTQLEEDRRAKST